MAMVTYESLYAHLAKEPFEPFRVLLKDGNAVDVVRPNQAVATCRQFIVGIRDHFERFRLDCIERIDVLPGAAA